jgi:DNA repair protein RadA/Sms
VAEVGRPASGGRPEEAARAVPITTIDVGTEVRTQTGVGELDRVLGGGLVRGSLVLIGGEPGIGKSTLLLRALVGLVAGGGEALYVTAEESAEQVRLRAERIGALDPRVWLLADRSLDTALAEAESRRPRAVIFDSVQTLAVDGADGVPGSLTQVREVAMRAMDLAKRTGVPVVLVGHVTKDGMLAGPKVLEHLVDAVLYFEGERGLSYRILRAHKNRFGSTNEIGVFEMKSTGLCEVANPSEMFVGERSGEGPGSVVTATMEGNRPLLVEVQALVSPCSGGAPRRTAPAFDPSRVAMLAAVLEKREDVPLLGQDIFFNVAGGMRLGEPAADLAVCAALVSSFWNRPLFGRAVIFGEVGLSGEVRPVAGVEARLAEARRLGLTRAVLPSGQLERARAPDGVEATPVRSLRELIAVMFER